MKKNLLTFWIPCLVFLIIFSMPGCVRQNHAQSAEIKTFRSGSLHVKGNREAPKTIYVDVRNVAGHEQLSASVIENALKLENFRKAESPSNAGYILHISVLQEGKVDPEVLQKLVKAGYGSEARFSGNGATALLTDALLVQRKVPGDSKPSKAKLKNITKRNALGSTQMRLGLLIQQPGGTSSASHAFLSDALAREIRNAISSQSQANAAEEGE